LFRHERFDVPALSFHAFFVLAFDFLFTRVLEAVEVPVVVEDGGVRLQRLLLQLSRLRDEVGGRLEDRSQKKKLAA
jgi:hypothetical protein